MGSYNSTVITTVGQALLASAIANQKDVVFSKFQVSDHIYPAGTDLSALTSLQSVQKETAPSGASVYDSTTIHSSATVDNSGVLSEFNANTLGLFITVDSTEVLFGVSTAITPDVFPKDVGGVPSTYTYSMNLVVSSTENVTISVDMDAYLTAADVVDNLITDNPTAPLSARQGKILKEMSSQALKVDWVGETTEKAYPINTVIYYGNKFMKVIKTGGLPINYTIVPSTDLEDADLDPKTIVTVEGMPASEALNAADIDYSNTTSGASATNVQGAIDEAFSDLSELSVVETDSTSISGIMFKKWGKIVTVTFGLSFTISSTTSNYTVGTIPEKFRPASDLTTGAVIQKLSNADNASVTVNGVATSAGSLELNATATFSNQRIRGTMVYMTD